MPTSELLSKAESVADLDKAFASAVKAMSKLGIDITAKKPNADKIGTAMGKSKKPAEFRLVGDKGVIKFQVETKDFSSVLGMIDTSAERDAQKRLAIMQNLAGAGLVSKAELKEAEEAARPAPTVDPNVVKNLVAKLTQLKAQKTAIADLTFAQVQKNKPMLDSFRKFMVKDQSVEMLDFLEAVDNKAAPAKIIADFIGPKSKYEVNINGANLAAALGTAGKPDFAPAYKEIFKVVGDPLRRFRVELSGSIDAQIATLKAAGKKAGVPDNLLV